MRRVEEAGLWADLKQKGSASAHTHRFESVVLSLGDPCLVIGGRNGAGKSRLLRSLAQDPRVNGLFLDLHALCEQLLAVLRSRDDFDEMKEEVEVGGPDADRQDDVQRIIGREYESVEWYSLEIEPSDEATAQRFRWGGDQAVVPYFRVRHRGVNYTSRDMGLGELSVHLLFWILEQYRGSETLTLLLDEPDAYLPPVGASSLLQRLLGICLKRNWQLLISSHASETITLAADEDAFVLVRTDTDGKTVSLHSRDDPSAAETLLAPPPVQHVVFVEDESACALASALLRHAGGSIAKSTEIVWGGGSGYVTELQKHLPRRPKPAVRFLYMLDGDKRAEVSSSTTKQWPLHFLPTDDDPDDLFRSLRGDVFALAARLHVDSQELGRFLDTKEGMDAHDLVNDLGAEYGRPAVLQALAELWIAKNPSLVTPFLKEIKGSLSSSR